MIRNKLYLLVLLLLVATTAYTQTAVPDYDFDSSESFYFRIYFCVDTHLIAHSFIKLETNDPNFYYPYARENAGFVPPFPSLNAYYGFFQDGPPRKENHTWADIEHICYVDLPAVDGIILDILYAIADWNKEYSLGSVDCVSYCIFVATILRLDTGRRTAWSFSSDAYTHPSSFIKYLAGHNPDQVTVVRGCR